MVERGRFKKKKEEAKGKKRKVGEKTGMKSEPEGEQSGGVNKK